MKNTNKLLSLGVALAIALCASVQVSAMNINRELNDKGRIVNPYLDEDAKEWLKNEIQLNSKMLHEILNEYENTFSLSERTEWQDRLGKKLKRFKDIYYGNKPYNLSEIYIR